MRALGLLAVTTVALSGCGGTDVEPVALTPDGFGEVVRDHVDREPSGEGTWDVMTRELGQDAPGAAFRFGDDHLAVAVAPVTDSPLVCADRSFFDDCVDISRDGHDLVLAWQELEPEEDPGVVYVIDHRDDEDVITHYSGTSIEGDPRDLDLGISVDQMVAIATDERLVRG